jgi:hypothetical protein
VEPLEALVAIEDVKRLKARYFRCLDTKDWAGFAALFTPDAVMDVSADVGDGGGPDSGVIRGNEVIAGFVRDMVGDVLTVHHGHTPEIEITSPTIARGVWAMEDELRWPDGAPLRSMHGYGHYHETYKKVGGAWLITATKLTRLRVDFDTGE